MNHKFRKLSRVCNKKIWAKERVSEFEAYKNTFKYVWSYDWNYQNFCTMSKRKETALQFGDKLTNQSIYFITFDVNFAELLVYVLKAIELQTLGKFKESDR